MRKKDGVKRGQKGNKSKLAVIVRAGGMHWQAMHTISGRTVRGKRKHGDQLVGGIGKLRKHFQDEMLERIFDCLKKSGYREVDATLGEDPTGKYQGKNGSIVFANAGDFSKSGTIGKEKCEIQIEMGEYKTVLNLKEIMRELSGYVPLPEKLEEVLRAISALGVGRGREWVEPIINIARTGGYQGGLTFIGPAKSKTGTIFYLPNVVFGRENSIEVERREGKRQKTEGILLYVDLLGMKGIIDRGDSDLLSYVSEGFVKTAKESWERSNGWFPEGKRKVEEVPRQMQVFSDSGVFTAEDSKDGLRIVCSVARMLLSGGVLRRFLVRGYIARGEIIWHETSIAGCEALRKAAAREREVQGIGVEVEDELACKYLLHQHSKTEQKCREPDGAIRSIGDWFYNTMVMQGNDKQMRTAHLVSWGQNGPEIDKAILTTAGVSRVEELGAGVLAKRKATYQFQAHMYSELRRRMHEGLPDCPVVVVYEDENTDAEGKPRTERRETR